MRSAVVGQGGGGAAAAGSSAAPRGGAAAAKRGKKGQVLGEARRDLYRFVSATKRMTERSYREAEPSKKGDGHVAGALADGMQEFDFYGVCGYPKLKLSKKFDIYEVAIVVQRPFGSLFADIIITNVMALLACTSFWDVSSPDLSARLSISLTIMLTLASYMSDRPPAIETYPGLTVHDCNEICCMIIGILISVQNCFAVFLCGAEGMVTSGAMEAPDVMVEAFLDHKDSICAIGWCGSRVIDCWAFAFTLLLTVVLLYWNLGYMFRNRYNCVYELAEIRADAERGHSVSQERGNQEIISGARGSRSKAELRQKKTDDFGKIVRRVVTVGEIRNTVLGDPAPQTRWADHR